MPLKFLRRGYLQAFFHDSRAIGVLLLISTLLSLMIANSLWGKAYIALLSREFGFLHHWHLPHSVAHIINEGLMSVFFLLAGMEIKRELTVGELSTVKKAVLPIGAAVGGMLVPALIYLLINKGGPAQPGWGIPMATDIAFSLGLASMLGSRFPPSLKVFLMALAIADDLGAIVVIAFFYGGVIKGWFLLGAMAVLVAIGLLNRFKVKFGGLHVVLGLLLWWLVFNSGIHASIAGVLFAFMLPVEKLPALEHALHKPVNFIILPLFALANTAIVFQWELLGQLKSLLSLGIIAGLFLGKPLGIVLACWILVRKGAAVLPSGVSWAQVTGAGILAGIGFTMSIFIACLAFSSAQTQDIAKMAILFSALLSVLASFVWMAWVENKKATGVKTVAE